jgi:UDPglucose 6-dehydrogenase
VAEIAIVGAGHVGLVTAACFAELGHTVTSIDKDVQRIANLRDGILPFFEPELSELVARNASASRLCFSDDIASGISSAEYIFIAVGTPMLHDGSADVSCVSAAAEEIARALDHDAIVINKSTVPVGTAEMILGILRRHCETGINPSVASNPEFLRQGSAVKDFMNPDRIVVGAASDLVQDAIRGLYSPLNATVIATGIATAEMIKYASNTFLAMKLSFINEIANICDRVGADILGVVQGVGSDKRIGAAYLRPGLGYGGSCFPKDVAALESLAKNHGFNSQLLPAIVRANSRQIDMFVLTVKRLLGDLKAKRIAVLGLSYKPDTDDVSGSPAIAFIRSVTAGGAEVVAHDPVAIPRARRILADVAFASSAYEAVAKADAVAIATDWPDYRELDFALAKSLMRGDLIIDTPNIYDAHLVASYGLRYAGMGRPQAAPVPLLQS